MIFDFLFKKPETKNWPHEIVNFLYNHYSETTTELNRFLYTKLKLEKHNTTHKDKIRELLDQLEEKGYITWIANKMDDKGNSIDAKYRETFKNITNDGLDTARVEARLTLDGLDYAIELEREKIKHTIYKYSTPMSVMFAALAFGVSLMTYLRGCEQSNQSQQIQLQFPTTITIDTLLLKKVRIQNLHLQQDSENNASKIDAFKTPTKSH